MSTGPIIVATDLSARNDRAVDRAVQLGTAMGRTVSLVHARSPRITDETAEQLAVLGRAALPDPAADVEIRMPVGPAPEVIAKTAEAIDAALVVCGVARFNGIGDYFSGTAVDHIITKGHRPVLVVKQRPHKPYDKVLAGTDFSDHSAHALAVAAELFPDAELHLVHAFHVPFEGFQKAGHVKEQVEADVSDEMGRFLARPELAKLAERVQWRLCYGGVAKGIRTAMEQVQPDLLVAGTHGKGGWRRATIGSIASDLLEWVPIDMLIVPPESPAG
ncbi:MAG: universal stress protein [Sphingomonadaceae bacterium]